MKITIIDYFEKTVRNFPDKIALKDIDTELTYESLKEASQAVGTFIAAENILQRPVAILMKRSVSLPVAMMGVLYSSNFYVVLDADSPAQRLKKIIATLDPAALIYEKSTEHLLTEIRTDAKAYSFETISSAKETDREILCEIRNLMTSESPAYALFTSGSTGEPKGALLTHGNVISYISWSTECFNITDKTVFGSQTPLYFSMSVSDLFSTMFTGSTYVLIPKSYFAFPGKLVSYMNKHKINTIYWVPSALGIIVKMDLFKYMLPEYLDKILFAGETMPVKYLNYYIKYLPDAFYANLFGPTETTDICTYYVVDRTFENQENLPIGKACANCELFIFDSELYVKGPFVAKGYYNNPEATEKAFVQNPLHNNYIDIVYKTGDLVEGKPYEELSYIGRKDFQIKHMGYRIEPGEIENALNTVNNQILTVCLHDADNDTLILAYESKEELDNKLLNYAEEKLPAYMKPEIYRRFDSFPVNQNGKTDRKRIKEIVLNEINGGK